MIITFKSRTGDLLAKIDSDTILSDRLSATIHTCPICKLPPFIGRDSGRWYLIGTLGCAACGGTYALPDAEELADMDKRNNG